MWQENILWDNKGQLKGIIDWGDAQISGLPLFDLAHVMFYTKKLDMHLNFGEFCEKYVLNMIPINQYEQNILKNYCEEIYGNFSEKLLKRYIFSYCLYNILKRIPYYIEIRFDEKWLNNNLFHLNRAVRHIS
jgi:hypothetical protein